MYHFLEIKNVLHNQIADDECKPTKGKILPCTEDVGKFAVLYIVLVLC